jgi:hypothetical protein
MHAICRIAVSGPSGLTEKLTIATGSAKNTQKTQQSLISIRVREYVGFVTRLRAGASPKCLGLPMTSNRQRRASSCRQTDGSLNPAF